MSTPTDPWRPASGCGPDCLPAPGRAPSVPIVRRAGRLLAVLGMLLAGTVLAVLLPVLPGPERSAAVRAWARGTLRAFGVRLVRAGRLPRRPALLVANHVSWLDILALLAVGPARMVAKREVRDWPLVGALASAAGTVWVDRSRPRSLPDTVAQVAAALRAGRPVAVFPEGTTWCGGPAECRPGGGFRPAMFQAAIDAGAPVVPVRIGYRHPVDGAPSALAASAGAPSALAAFVGEETLWRSVRRVLAAADLTVSVSVAGALHPVAGADRRVLARAAESAVHLVGARPARAARRGPAAGAQVTVPGVRTSTGELDLAA
ncbi:1-acyl-sn-glycerol-3-phosphate acyltransferase [Micromonospora sp. PLK6-60]|uniref:lysophospholipid acyltransferase family protein n=1 Tax=Micromonospora sp. PLK6-60 TaxID=2873383 RepID=UPI001CA75CDC|nr:lysophospholipid acyltransferase family protein [Micromonospora sp. PLK6-60]MBY8873467.1 1-acyl-sn-glycerol-3-phosphate acyltransferase [Micromonospora sp. PLK6-60]